MLTRQLAVLGKKEKPFGFSHGSNFGKRAEHVAGLRRTTTLLAREELGVNFREKREKRKHVPKAPSSKQTAPPLNLDGKRKTKGTC